MEISAKGAHQVPSPTFQPVSCDTLTSLPESFVIHFIIDGYAQLSPTVLQASLANQSNLRRDCGNTNL